MSTKYRHNKLGYIAEPCIPENMYQYTGLTQRYTIDKKLLENSTDWVPVTYEIREVMGRNIISVKRLSDGEVFSVNDKVQGGTIEKINKNEMWEGGLEFRVTGNNTHQGIRLTTISKLIELKIRSLQGNIVFRTYNPDDIIHLVSRDHKCIKSVMKASENEKHKDYIFFDTEKAADEYIFVNKGVFSLNEIRYLIPLSIYNKFIDTAKERI